jgi:haloacetate dehalogenase
VFDGFEEWDHPVADGVVLHGRHGGAGPAVVLLHGHPRAHTTWHLVAPALARSGLTVVCPDLRGYGRSSTPDPDERHETYCDRSMAGDVARLMSDLGHETFLVAGHDRGSGVAYRTALDFPDRVRGLAVLDGIPLLESFERTDARFATQWWHWFFFAGSPHAERVINADVDAWYGLGEEKRAQMGAENHDYLAEALHDPRTVLAMLEDYRAGLGIDVEHDRSDRAAGRRISCPTLVAWSVHDDLEELHGDPTDVWRPWVSGRVSGARIDSGHHMAEENPEQLAEVLTGWAASALAAGH